MAFFIFIATFQRTPDMFYSRDVRDFSRFLVDNRQDNVIVIVV